MKAALLGVDHPHSRSHLRTLQVLKEVEGIYLWDESQAALEIVRQEQGEKVIGTFTDLKQFLAQDFFFAIAACRNDLGPDILIQAFQAGKHVMSEKPIGRTAADSARVVDAAEKAKVQLGVVYQNRYNPVSVQARKLIHDGNIGHLVSVEARMVTTQVRYRNPAGWLFSKAKAGGGILSWLGCHYIDMIRYVSGDEIVSVSAEVATMSGENIDVEDVASLSFRFRSGAIGTMHAGYLLALSGSGYHNPGGYDNYMAFRGRAGRLYWDTTVKPLRLLAESAQPDWSAAPMREFVYQLRESPAYGGGYGEDFIMDFVRAAQGKGAPPTTGRDALQVARIIDAAYESSQTGRRVAVPLD